ncbi:forkhead box protein H1-like [Odontesthes bonariensis]|uniref:forkhead box protein H1-like n=1 Tax=Odontesthes bonariensis TaxID=219752 RepID=UPI003F58B829
MQRRTEKFGAQLPVFDPASSAETEVFRTATTYLAKIAVVLQDAPNKMLTFTQLMKKLTPAVSEGRKCVENNVRVCLSSHKCFVKIPMVQDSLNSKRNYWKLDSSQITAKMVRRHFKGILSLFPELAFKVNSETLSRPLEQGSTLQSPEAAACGAVRVRCEVKFSSPFSIESLLKRDSPSARASRASPLSSVQIRVAQQPQPTHRRVGTKRSISWASEELLCLQNSSGSSPICSAGGSTHHGLAVYGAVQLTKRISAHNGASFPFITTASTAPYFTSEHSSDITYSVPAVTYEAFCFGM